MNQLTKEHVASVTISDLQHEIKVLKKEVHDNKKQISYLENIIEAIPEQIILKDNVEHVESSNNDINIISKVFNKKWLNKVTLKVKDYKFEGTSLIDSGADQNVIQEGIIPSKYFEITRETLNGANNNALQIKYKILKVHVYKD